MNNLVTTGKFFVMILGELVLLFIGISFLVALIQQFVPDEKIREVLGKPKRGLGNMLGAAFGALTPFCSCSTVPILVGLLSSGAPFGASISFLLASPILNPIIIGLFLALFGWRATVVYGVITFALAAIGGAVWERMGMANQVKDLAHIQTSSCCSTSCCETEELAANPAVGCCETVELDLSNLEDLSEDALPSSKWEQLKPKLRGAGVQAMALFRQVLPYLVLGTAIGAVIYGFIPSEWIAKVAGRGNPLAVPVAAVIGIPMYIRAETIIPIGLTLIKKGMALGTVAALIIGGAGASIPEVTLLASIFRPRPVVVFVITIFVIAVATGFTFNALF